MAKFSTGLRNTMLASGSFKGALDAGFLDIYAGAAPATADAAVGGATKLCRVSVGSSGTGLTFASTATGGVLSKASAEVWSGVNLASGTATWFRFVAAADDGTESTTAPRIQGSVAAAGADLNMGNTSLVSGQTQPVDSFAVALPTL